MRLSPEQQAAVTRTGQDVCVVAGPGSGKTRVLVERFCWLIREQGISPQRILAITFTEKAATEIRQRLAKGFAGQAEIREQVERAYVSTVHGFCARLLRENPIAAGLDPAFVVLDGPQGAAELEDAAHQALDRLYRARPGELRELMEAIYVSTRSEGRLPDLAKALTGIYQAMRTAGKDVDALRRASREPGGGVTLDAFIEELRAVLATAPAKPTIKQDECIQALREWAARPVPFEFPTDLPRGILPDLKRLRDEELPLVEATIIGQRHAPLKDFLLDGLELIDQLFRQRKQEMGALDFADLEERAIVLVRSNPAVLGSFDQILMDELQDTNPLQWILLDLIRRHGRFFAVGDINQSIFGFRFAEPEVFRRYRDEVAQAGGMIDELHENYRSREEVLAAVMAVAAHAEGVEPHRLRASRSFPARQQPSVEVIAGCDETVEARWVARRILELVGELKLRFRDIAVLFRSAGALGPLLAAFQEFHVPFLAEGGKTFYETREVRDLVLLIRTIANPADEVALAGVLRSPLVGVSDETLLRMKAAPDAPDARVLRFTALLGRLRAECGDISPDRLIARVMDECDYEGGLDARARAGVDKFLSLVRGWFHNRPRPLAELVADLEWLRLTESESEAPPDDSSDVVRVMSIHRAKGLEFPVVFLPALHRGVGRDGPAICLSTQGGIGVRWRNPRSGAGLADLICREHQAEQNEREKREEDRLLYVAMTRAEEHLVLSFARTARPQGRHWQLVAKCLGEHLVEIGTDQVAEPAPRLAPAEPREEPLLVPPLALADQYDSTVSVTSVDLFALCPRRYYLARYLGWRGGASHGKAAGPSAAEFGTQVHALLAGAPAEGASPEALALVSRFESSELARRAARARRVEREFDFVMALEDVVLRGQIDLWFEEGGELILVDYKTDDVEPEEAVARADSYALQLRLYALALERCAGRLPDRAYVYLLRPDVAVPIALSAPLVADAGDVVRAMRKAQSEMKFELQDGDHCLRCPFYRGLCPAILLSKAVMRRECNSLGSGSGSRPL